MIKKILIIWVFCSNLLCACSNRVIFLFSTPRSLSTAFVRAMLNHEDFTCYSEPAMAIYFKENHPEIGFNFNELAFKNYMEMHQAFLKNQLHKNLFVKELGSRLLPLFDQYPSYYQNPNVYFVFLIRSPHKVGISLYRGLKKMPNTLITEENLSQLIMHEELWNTYQIVKQRAINKPIIILSDDLSNSPKSTLQEFCSKTQIPFSEDLLSWSAYDIQKNEIPNWHETKQLPAIITWNEEVLKSTNFHSQKNYAMDAAGRPTFDEIEDSSDKKKLKKAYFKQLPFYKKFIEEAIENPC